jgi:tRNA 2-thiouridine synthesizing protein A
MDEVVLDLRGLLCPQPVLRTKKALRAVPIGSIVVVECTDPLTVVDIPNLVNQTGHRLSSHERHGDLYVFRIVRQR